MWMKGEGGRDGKWGEGMQILGEAVQWRGAWKRVGGKGRGGR